MMTNVTVLGEAADLAERQDLLNFYKEILQEIFLFFRKANTKEISTLKQYLNDEKLFSKLEWACNWDEYLEKIISYTDQWEFDINWVEFREEDVESIVKAFTGEFSIEEYRLFYNVFSTANDGEWDFWLTQAVTDARDNIARIIGGTSLWRSIRYYLDTFRWM